MATLQSKTISANGSRHHTFTLVIAEEDRASLSNNHTKVTYGFKISPIGNGWDWNYTSTVPVTYSITINGTTVTGNIMSYDGASTIWIKQGELDIEHTIDGSKTISFSFNVSSLDASYLPGSASASGSMTLTKKLRASKITCSTGVIGGQATITIAKEDYTFAHRVEYTYGNLKGIVIEKETWGSFKWNIPTSFYTQIPNGTTGYGELKCTTYNGNTVLGTTTTNFTVITDEAACKPTLNPSIKCDSATYALTGDYNKFIKGWSSADYNIGAAARNSATLKNQRIICGSKDSTAMSGTLTGIDSDSFTIRAYDSRGYITEQTIKKSIVNYFKPTCNIEVTAPTADGKMSFTIKGNVFTGSFGKSSNQAVVSYRVKENEDIYLSWRVAESTLSGNTYSASVDLTGLNYQNTYTIQANIKDSISGYVYSAEYKVKTTPIFDWGENDFNFNVPISFNNIPMADFVVEQGILDNWHYRKWNSGYAECWRIVTVNNINAAEKNYSGFYYSNT